MENTEPELSQHKNLMDYTLDPSLSNQISSTELAQETLSENPQKFLFLPQGKSQRETTLPIVSQLVPQHKLLTIGIGEILLALILATCGYWLWTHWVIVHYDLSLAHTSAIAHLFRVQPFPALWTIILIGISLLCLIDAIRKITLSRLRS